MTIRILSVALMVFALFASGCHTCGHPLFAKSRRCDYCPSGPPAASAYPPPAAIYPPNSSRFGPSPDMVAPGEAPPGYPVQPSYSPRPYYPRFSP